jgi:hypothetical protein
MPHNFGGGFYTTTDVPVKPDVNHVAGKVQPSHSAGQNTTNQKTETNDREKQ